jgi:1-acyl-sn-glycerol-3-phosphate acyltransferase
MSATLRALLWTDPLILFATALLGTVSILVSLFDRSGRLQHRIARAWARAVVRIAGIDLQIEGKHRLERAAPYVFAANHRSLLDIPVALASIPGEFRFLANDYLFNWPFVGQHLRRAGHLPVVRANPRESLRSMTAAARAASNLGLSIVLFPEGGRTTGEMGEFRDGAAYIAIKAGVPLVPVALVGMTAVLPMGSVIPRPGPVCVRFGEPIPTDGLTLHARAPLTEQLYHAVVQLHGA